MILRTTIPHLFGAGGPSIWPLVLIDGPDNAPLLAHERVHWSEQWRWLVLPWWLLYLLWPQFRLRAEVRAYRVQIAAYMRLCGFRGWTSL